MNQCSVYNAADLIGKKWTIPLLEELMVNGDKGFNFISCRMRKISPKILANRLKELENSGIIEKNIVKTTTLRTKYFLTSKGMELYNIVRSMKHWNSKHECRSCATNKCVECELY